MQTTFLFLILAILALAGILVILVLKKKPQRFYKPKGQYLLSVGEKKFYDALLAALDSQRYIIFAKVRLAIDDRLNNCYTYSMLILYERIE